MTEQEELSKLRTAVKQISKKSKARRQALKDLQRAYIITQQALELTVSSNIKLIAENKELKKTKLPWWKR